MSDDVFAGIFVLICLWDLSYLVGCFPIVSHDLLVYSIVIHVLVCDV